jgi:hypothetical protein
MQIDQIFLQLKTLRSFLKPEMLRRSGLCSPLGSHLSLYPLIHRIRSHPIKLSAVSGIFPILLLGAFSYWRLFSVIMHYVNDLGKKAPTLHMFKVGWWEQWIDPLQWFFCSTLFLILFLQREKVIRQEKQFSV